jgi:hypothetical protein
MDQTQGQQSATAGGSEFNAIAFLVEQMIGRANTATLVKVLACTNSGDVSAVGFVDVQLLVNQLDGSGQAISNATVYKVPYFRLQGGTNAVILDPKVGDIGIAVFADHDISSVKANKGQANPGSWRRFDVSDGLYFGGVLNGVPVQYVQFNDAGGITVVSPVAVTVNAPHVVVNASASIAFTTPTFTVN